MTRRTRVAVLYGALPANAPPDEQDALVEAEAVGAALRALGFQPLLRAVNTNLDQLRHELLQLRPRFAFNLVESLDGRGAFIAWVPQLLDALGIPYTGVSADAQYLTSNKLLAKRWLAAHGLPTPAWSEDGSAGGPGAWIVKSVWEHASIGIDDGAVVQGGAAAARRIAEQRARHGGAWFAERFVDGREFNIALLEEVGGVRVLPVAEIDFSAFPAGKPRIVNYAAKWDSTAFEYHHTPRRFLVSAAGSEPGHGLETLARACWQHFGLRGYARVDIRLDADGTPQVLEINANPCLSPDAGYAAAAAAAGLDYTALIGCIVAGVLPRHDAVADAHPRSGAAT
ncbi:MAG: D-alanine--D-alanine ligase [Pseudomonadota bacterium]